MGQGVSNPLSPQAMQGIISQCSRPKVVQSKPQEHVRRTCVFRSGDGVRVFSAACRRKQKRQFDGGDGGGDAKKVIPRHDGHDSGKRVTGYRRNSRE